MDSNCWLMFLGVSVLLNYETFWPEGFPYESEEHTETWNSCDDTTIYHRKCYFLIENFYPRSEEEGNNDDHSYRHIPHPEFTRIILVPVFVMIGLHHAYKRHEYCTAESDDESRVCSHIEVGCQHSQNAHNSEPYTKPIIRFFHFCICF